MEAGLGRENFNVVVDSTHTRDHVAGRPLYKLCFLPISHEARRIEEKAGVHRFTFYGNSDFQGVQRKFWDDGEVFEIDTSIEACEGMIIPNLTVEELRNFIPAERLRKTERTFCGYPRALITAMGNVFVNDEVLAAHPAYFMRTLPNFVRVAGGLFRNNYIRSVYQPGPMGLRYPIPESDAFTAPGEFPRGSSKLPL
jgi:hypothetical protein